MIFNFLKPPQLDRNLSTEEQAVLGAKYFSTVISAALLVVVTLLAVLQPPRWSEATIGISVCLVILSITVALLKLGMRSTLGYACMAFSLLSGLWTIILLSGGYPISTLVWLPVVTWFAVPVLGYRIGMGFMVLNLASYVSFHLWMSAELPSLYSAGVPRIILTPDEFAMSFAIFLCITTLMIAIIDINRQRNESKLAQSEQMRNLYLEQTSMAVIHCDPSGEITDWNPAASEIFGYSAKEAIGQNAIRFLAVNATNERNDTLVEALKNGDARELRNINQNRTSDGTVISCEWFNTAICGEYQQLLGWIFSAVDITERITKEKELKRAKEQAEAATEAKSAFLANMSHEIRTPMNGVIGMTSLLASSSLDSDQSDYVETIRKSGNALLEIINEILDFSKIESGKLLIEEHPFSIRQCLQDSLNLFTNEVKLKDIELLHTISHEVPDAVRGDSGRLRQVLVNLVGNAVKFTNEGSVSVDVSVQLRPEKRNRSVLLKFAISDTGIGIPSDKIASLFDSFNQVDVSTTRKYGGTGLGLTITKRLVEIMGGEIWLTSEVGVGSTFHFTICLPTEPHGQHRQPSISQAAVLEKLKTATIQALPPLSILLVEDNLVNQKVAIHLLKRMGYTADVAANGLEAVEAVQRQRYDLVLMDVQMPEMDGLEATKTIRSSVPKRQQPHIIAMTAAVLAQDRQRALDSGMDGFVSKPIKAEELKQILKSQSERQARSILAASPPA